MRWPERLAVQTRMLFHRGAEGERLDRELQFHIDRQIAENAAAGMSAEEARQTALRVFGNPALLRDRARATWSWSSVELLFRDLRSSARTLTRTPGFAIIAMTVIALGIGANVALFAIVRSMLLKPLPFDDPSRLVRLYESDADGKFPFNNDSGGIFAEWKRLNRSFADMAITGYAGYNLSGGGGQLPESIQAATFSWNLLPLLGVRPALGRGFTAGDDRPAANPTVLLSWGLWKRRFGGDPAIVNQTIFLDARPYTAIGVMPAWFALPDPAIQAWTPIYFAEEPAHMKNYSHDFQVIARLKPGVSQKQAVEELSLIARRIRQQHPDQPWVSFGANSRPLLDSLVGDMKTPLYALLAATGCVFLIACLNVANLLVARAAARRREQAIRTALGGSRLRLLRQHLMESLLLAAAGGALGLLLAIVVLRWFVSVGIEQGLARSESVGIDGVSALFALGLIDLCAAFAGTVSAFSARGDRALAALQESSRGQSSGVARTRLRPVLLTLEVGLTVVLLIGAGLLLKSYARLRSSDLGCITQNVLKMELSLPQARYSQPAEVRSFFSALLERVRGIPGVQGAGLVTPAVPGDGYGGDNGYSVVEHPPLPQGKLQYAIHRWVDPGYFAAIGIPFRRGRTFDETQQPGHASEAIVSETFARLNFPREDPIGKHLKTWGDRPLEIVGIVGDTRFGIGDPVQQMMYFPFYAAKDMNGASLVVRSNRDVTAFSVPIQRIVAQMDRDLPVSDVLTMDQVIGRNTLQESFDATLLLVFAGLSVVLAAVGLYGVLSYLVAQRTGEIGIRIALGARREQVLRTMLFDGLRPAIFGLVLGLAASAGTVQLIESMLYGTQPLDPAVFAAVAGTLLLVAVVACLAPAWRASRLDPMQALRTE